MESVNCSARNDLGVFTTCDSYFYLIINMYCHRLTSLSCFPYCHSHSCASVWCRLLKTVPVLLKREQLGEATARGQVVATGTRQRNPLPWDRVICARDGRGRKCFRPKTLTMWDYSTGLQVRTTWSWSHWPPLESKLLLFLWIGAREGCPFHNNPSSSELLAWTQ